MDWRLPGANPLICDQCMVDGICVCVCICICETKALKLYVVFGHVLYSYNYFHFYFTFLLFFLFLQFTIFSSRFLILIFILIAISIFVCFVSHWKMERLKLQIAKCFRQICWRGIKESNFVSIKTPLMAKIFQHTTASYMR